MYRPKKAAVASCCGAMLETKQRLMDDALLQMKVPSGCGCSQSAARQAISTFAARTNEIFNNMR